MEWILSFTMLGEKEEWKKKLTAFQSYSNIVNKEFILKGQAQCTLKLRCSINNRAWYEAANEAYCNKK